jgi:tetratricopeptide (TPR) repeat protein
MNNSEKARRITGGRAGMRGYLVQTLIALLDGLLAEQPFERLTLEPNHASEKFDLLWEDSSNRRAIQVKSSSNQFTEGEVRRWAEEMEAAGTASEYHLCLVGLHSAGVAALDCVGRVILDKKNLDLPAFREQAAFRLERFLRAEGLEPGTPEDREMLADALTARLAAYSATGQPLGRTDLIKLLKTWVNEAPKEGPQIAASRLFRGKNTGSELLIGRDDELKALEAAWSGEGKKNIVTIVAWGGIGKTSLTVHWKNKLLLLPDHGGTERYFDWSFYSQGTRREGDATDATHAASADLFLKEALEFFGDPDLAASNAGAWQKGERLAQIIDQRRTLLILDGLEPLQDAKTGELRDDGLRALLRRLAAHNHGLCLVTTRQQLPELATWHQTTAPEWELARLTGEAGAALLTKLGVDGTDAEKRDLSARVKGHALTLTLLGNYLRKAHHGDIRRVDRVDFQKVNENEQGGHAFRVIAAYERWFEENNCHAELAILRMLGLFDRPATPDCLAALRNPPISGLTDAIAPLSEEDWNETVTHLVELNLVEEQPWEPRHIFGYSEEEAKQALMFARMWVTHNLGEPTVFDSQHPSASNRYSLDSHPLIREFFAKGLQETSATTWTAAHSRLFEHLRASVPYWPEGLVGLQPLYQAVAHGCQAGRFQEALMDVFVLRISRGTSGQHPNPHAFYSTTKLGAIGTDLSTVAFFFDHRWSRASSSLSDKQQSWLLACAARDLQALGRLAEASEPMRAGLGAELERQDWNNAARTLGVLSKLELTLGHIPEAVHAAEKSVVCADRVQVGFLQIGSRAYLAEARHQAGHSDALALFLEAEAIQARSPVNPLLNGVFGFYYCELLLAEAESAAWRAFAKDCRAESATRWCDENVASHIQSCREVEQRTAQTLQWATEGKHPVNKGLDHLTLGRAAFYHAFLESSTSDLSSASSHLDAAFYDLSQAGHLDELPRALLSRAWLRTVQNQPDLTREDLDEAWEIAERGAMKLFQADIHLHRARLFRNNEELKKARALIEQCGYWRRKEELEDAERAMT